MAHYEFGALLITRGECGMTLVRPKQSVIHLPAQSCEVYDVTGAGDTVIAVLASALAVGVSLDKAMKLANYAAGIAVSRLGTISVSASELMDHLQLREKDKTGILTREQLALVLSKVHGSGQRIIMAYGHFDILHSDVVDFLQYAKSLGDLLLVAVEDEVMAMVDPPLINTLEHRLTILQALEVVDWVIPYQKESLDHLVKQISPYLVMNGNQISTDEFDLDLDP